MSRPLKFTKTELKNAAQVAVSEDVSVCLKADGSIEIVPTTSSAPKEADSITTLTDWLAEHERQA